MKAVKVVAQPRDVKGSGSAGRLRRKGLIPAVVYGSGKEAHLIQLNAHDFEQMLRGHTGEHMVMDLEVGKDKALKVLLKEIQHDPVSHKIIHADFNEISMTKKLRVEIPVRLQGEPAGVTQQGGVLEHVLRQVEVECLPTDILEQIVVDVSGLHIGQSLTVADIHLDPAKYTVLTVKELAVAAVAAPKVEEEPTPEAAAEGAAAEPEVITEKKPEEGEEAEGEEGKEKGAKKEGKAEGKKEAAAKPEGKKEAAKPEAAKAEAKPDAKKGK
mgnify:CR=1 FL=1